VVLLHGFLGNAADWSPIVEGLGPDFACSAPDLPGHGASAWAEADGDATGVDFDLTVGALVEDLERRGLHGVVLVGYSLGGRLALAAGLRRPDLFRGLVLESASPGLGDAEERRVRVLSDTRSARALEEMSTPGEFQAFLRDWYEQAVFASLRGRPDLLKVLLRVREANDPRGLAAALRGLGLGRQPDFWPLLPDFGLPVLLICGALDRKFCQIAERMAELLPRGAVHEMAECGHNVHLDHPAGYTTVLKRFLEGA